MINLGSKVKDVVSGFTGIAISKHSYLNGCDRFSIQPSVDKDGKLPECETFDEPDLEVIEEVVKAGHIEMIEKEKGGPERYMPKRRR